MVALGGLGTLQLECCCAHPVEIPELSLPVHKERPFHAEWPHSGSLSPLQTAGCDPLPNRLAWLVARMRTRASGPGR